MFILAAFRITGEIESTLAFSKPRNQSQAGGWGVAASVVLEFSQVLSCAARGRPVCGPRAGWRWGLALERGGCRGPRPDDTSVSMLRSLRFGVTGIHKINVPFIKNPVVTLGQGWPRHVVEAPWLSGRTGMDLGRGGNSTHRWLKIWNCPDLEKVWLVGSGTRVGWGDRLKV